MSALTRLNLPPVWLIAFMGLAWGLAQASAPFGSSFLWAGRSLMAVGLVLMAWSAFSFRAARTTIMPHKAPSALVESGPYRLSRNPIYLADLIILLGWCVTLGAPLALITLVLFFLVLKHVFILPEERRLSAHLGAAYDAYKARVRRWI